MYTYKRHYDLWRSIAEEFGVPNAPQMPVGNQIRMVKALAFGYGIKHVQIPGFAKTYQPYPGDANTGDKGAAPILQFSPDAISGETGFLDEPAIHYEWLLYERSGLIDAALHFHFRDTAKNEWWANRILLPPQFASQGEPLKCKRYQTKQDGLFHVGWYSIRFRLPVVVKDILANPHTVAPLAARVMEHLIEYTWDSLQERNY